LFTYENKCPFLASSETQPDENESSDLIQSKNVEFLECKICRKWFPNMWILTSHMQIHEKKEQVDKF